MIADIADVMKPEMDRLVGNTLIPSYGKLPVQNKKFNQLIQYLEKKNKDLQVPNPTEKQKALQNTINTQLNLARLKILAEEYKRSDKSESTLSKILEYAAFRNWCGAGTNIYQNIKKDLDNPSNMYKIDTICRDHDMRYTKAKTQEDLNKADDIMMEEIMKKYILNFDKNFITGNYERDYSTWTSSFTSLYNQVVSLLEASFAVGLIKETALTALSTANQAVRLPFRVANYLHEAYRNAYPNLPAEVPRHWRRSIIDMNRELAQQSFNAVARTTSKFLKQGTKLLVSSAFRDKVYATIALFGISIKKSIEEFFPITLINPVEHDVSDEQLEEIIKVFELLQNEYLMDSGFEPIKIGNEWQNEQIEIPPIEQLQKEITEIVVMNKEYVEKRYEIAEAEETDETDELTMTYLNELDTIRNDFETDESAVDELTMTYLNELDTIRDEFGTMEENIEENIDENIEEIIE